MLRVLMLLEDFNEMTALQTFLQKMGFDVQGLQSPRALNDQILTMNPDVLLLTAFGKKVNGFDLSSGIRRPRGLPKIVLMHPPGTPTPASPNVESWILTPFHAPEVLKALSNAGALNHQQVEEKYQKLLSAQSQPTSENQAKKHFPDLGESAMESSKVIPGPFQNTASHQKAREERIAKVLAEEPGPSELKFDRKVIEQNVKDLRRSEDPVRSAAHEKERRAVVEAMFRKKRN